MTVFIGWVIAFLAVVVICAVLLRVQRSRYRSELDRIDDDLADELMLRRPPRDRS